MADMKNTGYGLLSEYGLDLGEEKDIRSAMRAKRIADAMKFVPNPQGRDGRTVDPRGVGQSFGFLGAALGNAFGEKFRQDRTGYGDLPPEIANRLNTVKQSKEMFTEWQKANPDADRAVLADKYQEILAESAFENDLPDIGLPILRQLQERRDAKAKQDAELKRLELGNKFDESTIAARIAKEKYAANAAGVVQFYPYGSSSPNTGLTGRLDEDGNITTIGEDGKPKVYTSSQYTFDRPQWHPDMYNRGSGGDIGMSPTAQENLRRDLTQAMNFNDGIGAVLDLVKEARESGGGNPQGTFGKVVSAGNRWVGFVEQAAAFLSPTGMAPTVTVRGADKEYNVETAAGRKAWAKDNAEWIRKNVPGLKKAGQYADQYIALMTELAYAKAMTNEGGSTRSLSDNDFKNSVIQIGGNLSDPVSLTKVLLADSDRLASRMDNRFSVYHPRVVAAVINERGFERYEAGRKKLEAYRDGSAFADKPAAPKSAAPEGWQQADWDYLTPEEQATILKGRGAK